MEKFFYRKHGLMFIGAVLVSILIVSVSALIMQNQNVATSVENTSASSAEKSIARSTATETMSKDFSGVGTLQPPEYYADLPNPLITNHKGEVRVAWTPVPGAKRYVVMLYDHQGNIAKKYFTEWNVIYLKDVPLDSGAHGATYLVRVASENADKTKSEYGPSRTLNVKPLTTIVAPQVQEIRVED